MSRKLIGRRKKKSLQAGRAWRKVAYERWIARRRRENPRRLGEILPCHEVGDIKHRIALRHHKLANEDAAVGNHVKYVERRYRMIEVMLARLQFAARAQAGYPRKYPRITQHSLTGQDARNPPRRNPMWNIYIYTGRRKALIGHINRKRNPSGQECRHHKDE